MYFAKDSSTHFRFNCKCFILRNLRCSAFSLANSKNAKEIHLSLHNAQLTHTDLENIMLKSKHLCLDLQDVCISSIGMAWMA